MLLESTPRLSFGQMKKECKGGEKSNHKLTTAFFVNGMGQSEYSVVIWKSQNRCFKGVKKGSLPVCYYSQLKTWMTGEILHDVLTSLNHSLRAQGRYILSSWTMLAAILLT